MPTPMCALFLSLQKCGACTKAFYMCFALDYDASSLREAPDQLEMIKIVNIVGLGKNKKGKPESK